jgi:hypothetical protein
MAGTPNIRTLESAVLHQFPDARFGRHNCRHISSNPLRSWSQHAGSEPATQSYGNALDISHKDHHGKVNPAHTAWLKAVYRWIKAHAAEFQIDQLLGPGDAGHANHVHGSTWPKMRSVFWYKPPCRGGNLQVEHKDGTPGTTFGDIPPPPPPPNMETDMALQRNDTGIAVQRHQQALIAWNPDALPQWGADADYGAETEAWVKLYQDAADLASSLDFTANPAMYGQIDGVTSSLLIENLPGSQGERGEPGPQGDQGEQGPQGEPGPQPTTATFGYE